MVERLMSDVVAVQNSGGEAQLSQRATQTQVDRLEVAKDIADSQLRLIDTKLAAVDEQLKKAAEEKRDAATKLENNVNLIWDQIRHMENSLSQRLTLAETSQVSMLQEVDDIKEGASEVLQRVDDLKRLIAALENKLESFNTQVAAAISPLHNRWVFFCPFSSLPLTFCRMRHSSNKTRVVSVVMLLNPASPPARSRSMTDVKVRLDDLASKKQDVATALNLDDVNVAVSRAIDHADRRADNIIKSIGAMEERVEELNDVKANKSDVVMTTDLEALLTSHAAELDRHLDALKEEILKLVSAKADKDEMAALDSKLGARIGSLENAILKGLKAISDKVCLARACAEPLPLSSSVNDPPLTHTRRPFGFIILESATFHVSRRSLQRWRRSLTYCASTSSSFKCERSWQTSRTGCATGALWPRASRLRWTARAVWAPPAASAATAGVWIMVWGGEVLSSTPSHGGGEAEARFSITFHLSVRVRSVKDMQSMGFTTTDKVFSPEKLPTTEGLLPSITRSVDVAAYSNAKLKHLKKEATEQLKKPSQGIPDAVVPPPGGLGSAGRLGSAQGGVSVIDAGSMLQTGEVKVKVDVETISGAIAQGRIPNTRASHKAGSGSR